VSNADWTDETEDGMREREHDAKSMCMIGMIGRGRCLHGGTLGEERRAEGEDTDVGDVENDGYD
jgi:hypothetical protein